VHNHLWEAKIARDENRGMRFTEPPTLREGYGDKWHVKVMDPATRKSRNLGINMFPARIWRRDAYIALKTIAKALNTLESMDRSYVYLSPNHFQFQGQTLTFEEVTNRLSILADA